MSKSSADSNLRKVIASIHERLAVDFVTPAREIINQGFYMAGLERFTKDGKDLWEVATGISNPKHRTTKRYRSKNVRFNNPNG